MSPPVKVTHPVLWLSLSFAKILNCKIPVIWMDRGLHNTPEKLKIELQKQIDQLQDADEILLSFGLCGNGTDELVSKSTSLVIPKFDDCLNLMLCTAERTARGLTKADSLYLTRGWTLDSESILRQYDSLLEKYDEETRDIIFETMYEHYHTVNVIDTGCYDLRPVLEYAEKAAELLDLETETIPGSNRILKQLLTGEWDENFIVLQPGEMLSYEHFDF